jgi:hypothetical protein
MGSTVISDEGFSIQWGRDALRYTENGRSMLINIDSGANEVIVFTDTVTRWDDDPATLVDKNTRDRIADNILRALTFYQERYRGKVTLREYSE